MTFYKYIKLKCQLNLIPNFLLYRHVYPIYMNKPVFAMCFDKFNADIENYRVEKTDVQKLNPIY